MGRKNRAKNNTEYNASIKFYNSWTKLQLNVSKKYCLQLLKIERFLEIKIYNLTTLKAPNWLPSFNPPAFTPLLKTDTRVTV